ncbi:hypothetical protein IF2G_03755 [Cordyceps javanica]|nr:hypothetical protein IF2G_03755 [Cordyceps javanica]
MQHPFMQGFNSSPPCQLASSPQLAAIRFPPSDHALWVNKTKWIEKCRLVSEAIIRRYALVCPDSRFAMSSSVPAPPHVNTASPLNAPCTEAMVGSRRVVPGQQTRENKARVILDAVEFSKLRSGRHDVTARPHTVPTSKLCPPRFALKVPEWTLEFFNLTVRGIERDANWSLHSLPAVVTPSASAGHGSNTLQFDEVGDRTTQGIVSGTQQRIRGRLRPRMDRGRQAGHQPSFGCNLDPS